MSYYLLFLSFSQVNESVFCLPSSVNESPDVSIVIFLSYETVVKAGSSLSWDKRWWKILTIKRQLIWRH